MLRGPIWSKIPRFALPVAATAILEQLFNASDIAVVGNFTGDASTAAVAAVGANSAIIGLIVNLFIGIALGANVVIAHAVGHGDRDTVDKAVHTSVLLSLLGARRWRAPVSCWRHRCWAFSTCRRRFSPWRSCTCGSTWPGCR